MITRHLETLFCDDIRREDNGKVIYIGVYSDALLVKSFPLVLPKICISAKAVTPLANPFSNLTLKIYKNDEILQELPVEESQLPPIPNLDDIPKEELDGRAQVAQFNVVISPLPLDSPFALKVRLETDVGELEGLDLRIDQLPSNVALEHEGDSSDMVDLENESEDSD